MTETEHEFQIKAKEKLKARQSILIVAPTGLGKTRAALQPFTDNNTSDPLLITRLIYSLPLRALARGVVDELERLNSSFTPVIHHGDEPESKFFSERAIITTIDQYFTAFAGAPLSWASHWSHAAAGAIFTSYSVFDEVHLLSPRAGLQLLFAVLRLRQRWGLLSCVMTATLPEAAIKFFKDFCSLEIVEASTEDIAKRDSWRKVKLKLLGKEPGRASSKSRQQAERTTFEWEEKDPQGIAELVKEKWESWSELEVDGPRKVIVFVNTVDRAIQVYEQVYKHLQGFCPNVLLAHSRFTKEHRQQVEERIHQFFGRNAQDAEAVLITTQVAEAGLNISAPLVISELAPMDVLVQRAGRCQRFKPNDDREMRGLVLVVKPKTEGQWHAPYLDYVIVQGSKGDKRIYVAEASCSVLEQYFANGGMLDWSKEKNLISEALSEIYKAFLKGLE